MSQPEWLNWVRRLQAIAQIGLTYASSPADRERYAQMRAIAAEMASAHTGIDAAHIAALYAQESGYMTPKVALSAVIFDSQRALLLVRHDESAAWSLPTGWPHPGESPSDAAARMVQEQTGYTARAIKLLAAYDRDAQGHPAHTYAMYRLFIHCTLTSDAPRTNGAAIGETRFFPREALPRLDPDWVLSAQIERFFSHAADPSLPTDFD